MQIDQQFQQRVTQLISTGQQAQAIALVRERAGQGDTWSRLALAEWLLAGQGVPRDTRQAVALLEECLQEGVPAAAMRLVTLYATGTGCAENPKRARALVEQMKGHGGWPAAQAHVLAKEPDPDEFDCETISGSLPIKLYRCFASRLETEWIRNFAQPALEPSFVEDPATGRRIPHPVRTSSGMSFGPLNEDLVVNRINRRIARVSGTEYAHAEPLHILRYAQGQEYRPHFDALPGKANQRRWTAILYLNEGFEGGETRFPKLDVNVKGQEGDLLLFANVDGEGHTLPDSEHAGLPVSGGEKWIATRWIRGARYHPWDLETWR